MSIIITGVDMPKSCTTCGYNHELMDMSDMCELEHVDVTNCIRYDKKHDDCPIKSVEGLIKELNKCKNTYPKEYSDKIYDAVTIDEGIEEVQRCGIRLGFERAIHIIKQYCGMEETNANS